MSQKRFLVAAVLLLVSLAWAEQKWLIKAPDSLTVGTVFTAEIVLPDADLACSIETEPQIKMPLFDTLPDLSLLDVKVVEAKDGIKLSHQFIFTSGGLVSLPSLSFTYPDQKGNSKKITSDSYPFVVHSLLDTTIKDIADVRPPQSVYLGALEYLTILFGLAILLLVIFLLSLLLRGRRNLAQEQEVIDDRPAWQVGLQSLRKAEKSLQKGNLLDYFFRLSFSLRIFLERAHHLSATQMTTDELKEVIRLANMSQHNKLFEIFAYADLVKFAKYAGDKALAEDYCRWAKQLFWQAKKEEEEKAQRAAQQNLSVSSAGQSQSPSASQSSKKKGEQDV